MASTRLIDNGKAVLLMFIMPMIQFRGCMQSKGAANRDVKEVITKWLKDAPIRQGGKENQSFKTGLVVQNWQCW